VHATVRVTHYIARAQYSFARRWTCANSSLTFLAENCAAYVQLRKQLVILTPEIFLHRQFPFTIARESGNSERRSVLRSIRMRFSLPSFEKRVISNSRFFPRRASATTFVPYVDSSSLEFIRPVIRIIRGIDADGIKNDARVSTRYVKHTNRERSDRRTASIGLAIDRKAKSTPRHSMRGFSRVDVECLRLIADCDNGKTEMRFPADKLQGPRRTRFSCGSVPLGKKIISKRRYLSHERSSGEMNALE
jgi:hypothetical protein